MSDPRHQTFCRLEAIRPSTRTTKHNMLQLGQVHEPDQANVVTDTRATDVELPIEQANRRRSVD